MVVLLATHEEEGREVIPHPLLMVVLLVTHEVRICIGCGITTIIHMY